LASNSKQAIKKDIALEIERSVEEKIDRRML
jgi:hypothetical protein